MEEDKEIPKETLCHSSSDGAENVMQQSENVTSTRDRKLTEKGQLYK